MKYKTKLCKSDQDVRSPNKEIWLWWTTVYEAFEQIQRPHKYVLYSCNLFIYMNFFLVICSFSWLFLLVFLFSVQPFYMPLYIKHSLLGPFVVILLFNVVIFTLTLVILHLLFVLFVCFFSCHIFYNSCFYLWCQLVCLCSFQLHEHIQVACVHLGNCLHHSVKHFLIRPDIIIIYIFIVF